MKVFKYLVALADISVGFLGLFFIIFAVARPSLLDSAARVDELQATIDELKRHLVELEKISLSDAKAGTAIGKHTGATITIGTNGLSIRIGESTREFATVPLFERAAAGIPWPPMVLLLVDKRVDFDQVVRVIDALKRSNKHLSVRIGAKAGG